MQFKRIITLSLSLLLVLGLSAQPRPRKFDPKKFEADLEQFISTEAGLTPQEAAKFFPLYREMRKKQFAYFNQDRFDRHVDMSDENQCENAIRNKDNREIKMKEIQQTYHNKFLRIMPATKVMRIIKAEDKFHRQTFDRVVKRRGGQRSRKPKQQ